MQDHQISIEGQLDQVEKVCRLVGESATSAGFNEKDSYACQLAVSEAIENIILHGYQSANGEKITVNIEVQSGDLAIEIVDQAPPFNPSVPVENQSPSPEDPPVGGLGLVIMHKVMDEVEYKRERGKNLLRMRKRKKPKLD